ncbi:outer membrane protein assembly factor BamB [Marmoricola sp. URHA0025 HA25]
MNQARWTPSAAVVGALLLLAGCGESDEAPAAAPAKASTVTAGPANVVARSLWKRGEIHIFAPDGLAFLGSSVYVKSDDGHVVRVDAQTGKVLTKVKVDTTSDPSHYCQGIGTDGTTLWTCSAADGGQTDVVRLDPVTLEVLATVKVDKVFDQEAMPVRAGTVWVLTGTGETLTTIDTATNRTTDYPLGRRCFQVAVAASTAYATCRLANEMVAVDARTGKVIASTDLPDPVTVVADDDAVWVSTSKGVVGLSGDLQPRTVFAGLTGGLGDLLLTEGSLWVRQDAGFLFRVDTSSQQVAAQYGIDPVPSGGSLVAVGDEIWTSSYDDNVVFRVHPAP